MTRMFVFPGQGSQRPGMGAALADAFAASREVFEEVDDALGRNLTRLMREGDAEDLMLTSNAQPALMAVSVAVLRVIVSESGQPVAALCRRVAGHSLGEYSALVASGVLGLADTARLLDLRGRAMQEAVPAGEGAMAAVLGLEIDDVTDIAAEASRAGVCVVGNDNAPSQVVVSGKKEAVELASDLASERGAGRVVPLQVSAPFHSPLMEPAARRMEEALAAVTFATPAVPVVSNVTARPETAPSDMRRLLVDQVTARVRWRESMSGLADHGVVSMAELGAGRTLCGLMRKIDRDIKAVPVETPGDVETFLNAL
ncbi:MAG: ACP S-malonyltransferase [bacterium]|nr:ACP S-malonyltransferase [bacterium]